MPTDETQQFGWLDYEPGAEIEFPHGLPGFDEERRFLLLERLERLPVWYSAKTSVASTGAQSSQNAANTNG